MSSKISIKAVAPEARPAPKSRNDVGVKSGYLYLISVMILTAEAKVRGALLSR